MTPAETWRAALSARLAPISLLLAAAYAVALALLWAGSSNGLDAAGRPLGTDFSNVWSAGRLALQGAPEAVYDFARHYAEQQAIFGPDVPFYGWHYPPMFLLVAAGLATLPYLGALALWQAATLPLYLFALARIVGSRRREVLLAGLAFPAVFVNLTHGQNGFLTAGLIGFGLALLDRRPFLAGALIGFLAYKPQFGVLVPLALMVSGRWTAFAGAACSAVATMALSLAWFGPDIWAAFLASGSLTRTVVLEAGGTGWHKIVTVFSAARALGAGVATAYALQAAAALAAAIGVARIWRGDAPFGAKAAALITGSLLVTPYALDYDLMLLAPAIAFLAQGALRIGWRPAEAPILAAAALATLVARPVAEATLMPIGLISVVALFALAASRGLRPSPALRAPVHA